MYNVTILAQSLNLEMERLKFRPDDAETTNQVIAFGMVGIALVVLGVAVFFYIRHRRKQVEVTLHREDGRLRLLMTELSLGDTERAMLETLVESDVPRDVIPLLESRAVFEETVEAFREAHPRHEILRRIGAFRQRLDYGFRNIRNPFVDTRMLPPGIRLSCRIPTSKKKIQFLTTLIGGNEDHFIIRPPTSRGKPLPLGRVGQLHFGVARENDAEYEFTATVAGQMDNEMRAVVMNHTREIGRLLFRNADRYEINMEMPFFVIRQELVGEKAPQHFKARDSQFRQEGLMVDLSIGGARIRIPSENADLQPGDLVIFQLEKAQIRDDIVGMIVGKFSREGMPTQYHLQFQGLKELNRLKMTKFLENLGIEPLPLASAPSVGSRPPRPRPPAEAEV